MENVELIESIDRLLKKDKKLTKARIAGSVDISPSQLTQFMNGKYKISEEVKAKLELYVANYAKKGTRKPLEAPFVVMKQAKSIFFVADECREEREMGIVYGHPGTGKTRALAEYASLHPESVLIEVKPEVTVRNFLWGLADAVGADRARSKVDTTEAIIKRIKKRDTIILVDEAEHLQTEALEHIRRIWDFTGTPVVLAGTEVLLKNLMGPRGDMAQLYSRIGLKWVTQPIEGDEGGLLCKAWGLDPALGPVVVGMTGGNLRKSEKLIKRAIRLASLSSADIDEDLLDEAGRMLIL